MPATGPGISSILAATSHVIIEAKYQIPQSGTAAMTRLASQMDAAVRTGDKVVLWLYKAPSPAQLQLLVNEIGWELYDEIVIVSAMRGDLIPYFKYLATGGK